MYWPYLLLLYRLLLLLALLFHRISHEALPSQSSKGSYCKFSCTKGHDIFVYRKFQKFLQKQNKGCLPQATAILHIHLWPSHSLQLTFEAVVQHILSSTFIALFVTLGIHSWFFDNVRCNHVTCDAYQFFKKNTFSMPHFHLYSWWYSYAY